MSDLDQEIVYKTINQHPKITDIIRFTLETPDADDCLVSNPYKVDNVKIYYVEKDFLGTNYGEYNKREVDDVLIEKLKKARADLCEDPSEQNIAIVNKLQNEVESKSQLTKIFYKDYILVESIGTDEEPAWLSTDQNNALIEHVTEDDDGETIYGHFAFEWSPKSKVREGDFFICWTWTPNPAGDSISAHIPFVLNGDGKAVQTIPIHITPEHKYNTLLERYLPEVYKTYLSDKDITPEVTDKLNQAVANGFTFIEDYANQVIDLYDANVLHESLLLYLSNLFNLRLKSQDPTLWRRQIKEAIPLFKKKGTLLGLKEALAQSGMVLDQYTNLWQLISPYTWQQSFLVKDSPNFKLDKKPLSSMDDRNFSLWIRREGEDSYQQISVDMIEFYVDDCEDYIVWVGDEKSVGGMSLYEGDIIRILYQYQELPSGMQSVENYIRSLSLADGRDEALIEYPPKNWNVRVIAEDDPMFDVLIPVKHPFHDNLIFGQIRTEFPFSENIYNMEEYNGSTRDSYDVCFIDKAFRDPCGSCLSSKYNIDIGIEELSDNRLVEVYDILDEYTPFTSVPHQISFRGEVVEYVTPSVEEIEFLVHFNYEQSIISGSSNPFFHRVMEDGLTNWVVDREDLSEQTIKVSGKIGTAYNANISFISTNVTLENLGLIIDNHILEVLSPSSNSGKYSLDNVVGQTARVATSVTEPLNGESFTFKLSNIVYETLNADITQENCAILTDANNSLENLSIRTLWDVEYDSDYTGSNWVVYFPSLSETYDIDKIEGGSIYLTCDTDLVAGTYSYILMNDDSEEILSSATGTVAIFNRGRISIDDPEEILITSIVHHGDYMLYDGDEYLVDELKIDGDIIVNDYSDGDASGIEVKFLRRLAVNETGYFVYSGLRLLTTADHESEFEIQNGSGSPVTDPDLVLDNSNFKENYLFKIGLNYYKIIDINATNVVLSGFPQDWGTLISGGTEVQYSIHQFVNDTVETQFVVFDQLDRRGKDPVLREVQSTITSDIAISALSLPPGGGQGVEEILTQEEGIDFEIEYDNGNTENGTL